MANTQNQGYPLPTVGELLSNDIHKLIAAFNAIDVDISALVAGLDGKAASGHTHTIANITGLQNALDDLASNNHTHGINDLTDVDTSAAATGYIIVLTTDGWVAKSPVAALGDHGHTIAQVTNLQPALDEKLAKASNLADLDNPSIARNNLGLGSIATRAVTISTADPSGGADGDIWLKYEAAT